MDNFFTSPSLLRLLKGNGMAATGTVRANRTENAPLQAVDDMKKMSRGSSDVVNDNNSFVTRVFAGKRIKWWQLLQHFMEKNR